LQESAEAGAAFAPGPGVKVFAQGGAGDGEWGGVEKAEVAQVEHDLGYAAGEKYSHGRMMGWAVGKNIDEARSAAIDVDPIGDGGARKSRGVSDGGDVKEEIRRTAECGVNRHCVANARASEDVFGRQLSGVEMDGGAGGRACEFEPDRLAGRGESGMREREAKGFRDDLGCGGGSEELAAAPG